MLASSKKTSTRRQPKASKQPRVTCDELVTEPIISQDDIVIAEKPKLKRSPRKSKLVENLEQIPVDIPISIDVPSVETIVFLPDEDSPSDIPATFVDDVPDVTPVVDTVECPCGSVVSKKGLSKHLKSKKHMMWVAQQEALTVPGC